MADTIEDSLESILSQVDNQFEVVIVDAGSDDGSIEIFKEYEKERKIKLEIEEGCTRGKGRNMAAEMSEGDVLLHQIDMDDIYLEGSIDFMVEKYEEISSKYEKPVFINGNQFNAVPREAFLEILGGYKDLQVEDKELWERARKNKEIEYIETDNKDLYRPINGGITFRKHFRRSFNTALYNYEEGKTLFELIREYKKDFGQPNNRLLFPLNLAVISLARFKHLNLKGRGSLFDYLGGFRNWEAYQKLVDMSYRSPEGSKISDFQWDNLIILDACRHDTYEKVTGKEVNYRYSARSCTPEYIEENFSNQDYKDTVYITGNPHFSEENFMKYTGKKPEEVFDTVYHTWDSKWDEEEGTVKPEKIIEDAKSAEKLFTDKRKIIHFMQPHHPFLNSDIKERGAWGDDGKNHVWEKVHNASADSKKISKEYEKNLQTVLDRIDNFIKNLNGRTVITSDHANYLGERGLYGHPSQHSSKIVRKVPLHTIKKEKSE